MKYYFCKETNTQYGFQKQPFVHVRRLLKKTKDKNLSKYTCKIPVIGKVFLKARVITIALPKRAA